MWNFIFNLAQQSGNYTSNTATVGVSYNKQFERALFKALLKLLVLVTILWLINIAGWQALNLIPFFGITVLLIAVGFSPIALSATALTGAVTRVDQIKGMPTGIPAGAQIWIARVLPAIIVSCHILVGFLATWSFAANPLAFWYFAMACITICSAVLAWKKMEGDFLFKLVVGYSAMVAIFALITTQWPDAGQWLDREGRAAIKQQQVVAQRQAEIDQAAHDARVAEASRPPARVAPTLPSSVIVPTCNTGWSQEISLPVGWLMTPAWQTSIAKAEYLGPGATDWTTNWRSLSSVTDARYCVNTAGHERHLYGGKEMALTWTEVK